jgi:hypothetical protein
MTGFSPSSSFSFRPKLCPSSVLAPVLSINPMPVTEPQERNVIQAKIAVAQATATIEGDDGGDHGYP